MSESYIDLSAFKGTVPRFLDRNTMDSQISSCDVLIIGSGLAGLTAAHALKQRGISAVILESENDVGSSWARRHPQLTLNTHRTLSALPGLKYPQGTAAFPKRDAVIAHLQAFRDQHLFDIRYNCVAVSVDTANGHFVVSTNERTWRSMHLVIATGRDRVASIPQWKGLDTFSGELVHAADFGDAKDYMGKSVLVIGGGNSGFDVLNHLVKISTSKLWLSARHGPNILPKRLRGFSVHRLSPLMALLPTPLADRVIGWTQRLAFGDLTKLGFPPGQMNAATRLIGSSVAIAVDDGAISAIKRGRIDVVSEVVEFSDTSVILENGVTLKPDVVFAAVRYSAGINELVGKLGVLDDRGAPIIDRKTGLTAVSGLWFVGTKPSLTSYFRQAQREATLIAKSIAKSLKP